MTVPAARATARPAVSTLTFVNGPISAVVAMRRAAMREAAAVATGGASIWCDGRARRRVVVGCRRSAGGRGRWTGDSTEKHGEVLGGCGKAAGWAKAKAGIVGRKVVVVGVCGLLVDEADDEVMVYGTGGRREIGSGWKL